MWHFLISDYCHLVATKNLKSFCDIAVNIFLLASYAHHPLESPKDPLRVPGPHFENHLPK